MWWSKKSTVILFSLESCVCSFLYPEQGLGSSPLFIYAAVPGEGSVRGREDAGGAATGTDLTPGPRWMLCVIFHSSGAGRVSHRAVPPPSPPALSRFWP